MVDARRTFYENAMENEDDKHARCLEIGQTTGVYIALKFLFASKEHKTNFMASYHLLCWSFPSFTGVMVCPITMDG